MECGQSTVLAGRRKYLCGGKTGSTSGARRSKNQAEFNGGKIMNKQLTAILAVVVIIGSVFWIYRQQAGPQMRSNVTVFRGLGEVVAEQTLKAINNRGQVVVWLFKHTDENNPAMEAILKALNDALKKAPNVKLLPNEKVMMASGGEGVTSEVAGIPKSQFLDLMQKYSAANLVISFIGMPPLSAQDKRSLGDKFPKLLIVDTFEYAGQAKQYDPQLVAAAIVPRLGTVATNNEARTARQMFDRYFQVLTAD
jgi:hypothetical protein